MDDKNRLATMTDALSVPFPREALKQRSGGNKTFTYVEGHTVIHRLIDATANQWDFKVLNIESRPMEMKDRNGQPRTDLLMMAAVELTIPGLGTRQHVGVQMVAPGSGEDLVKGCVTDALKKCATLFGVGLELSGPDYEAGEVAPSASAPVARPQPPQRPQPAPTPISAGNDATAAQMDHIARLALKIGMAKPGKQGELVPDGDALDGMIAAIDEGQQWPDISKATASALIDLLNAEVRQLAAATF